MNPNPYSTSKLIHHPKALQDMRERKHQNPIQIHFMPALACNQHCSFCSYGHRTPMDGPEQQGWKNMKMMSDDYMSAGKMRECVKDWKEMGVKAIELTGGGEPLIYPHVDEFLELVAKWGVDFALVSNGTALTEERAGLFGQCNWKWARISIDAGDSKSYAATRRVPESHWNLAWRAVSRLTRLKTSPGQKVGVGYVVDHSNYDGIYAAAMLAAAHGADNIRISLAFTPHHLARFPVGAVQIAIDQAAKAKRDLEGAGLQVIDLVGERAKNIQAQAQDYQFCPVKEVICVVGGDEKVYSCCTLAFNPLGLIGSIRGQSFKDLWWNPTTLNWFDKHDARKVCKVPCLYEARNRVALRLLDGSTIAQAAEAKSQPKLHENFI